MSYHASRRSFNSRCSALPAITRHPPASLPDNTTARYRGLPITTKGNDVILGGLDIGTSNCKLSIYDDTALAVQVDAPYAAVRSNGRHSLDANLVWGAVKSLFRRAIDEDARAAHLEAVAVSALGEAAVPVDAGGRTLGDALLFWDNSGADEAEELVRKLGKETIQSITGVIPHSMYTLCKIAWQKKHSPHFSRARHFLLFEDFIIYRLTGERRISYSLAGRTMGLDIRSKKWSDALFNAAGIDPELMSRPSPSGAPAGIVAGSVARELGLKGRTLVTTGGHDQMCVALGAGALRAGIASNGSGTVEVLAVTLRDDADATALHADNYTISIHADPAARFTYSCNSTGSILLDWFVKAFGSPDGGSAFAEFESRAPGQPTSIIALPYLAGSGTPFMDLGVRGGLYGLDLASDKYSIYRALMEGLAYDLAYNLGRLTAAGAEVREIRTTGGGSLSRMWSQIKADMTGVPVSTLRSHQAGALGCMMLAAVAAGMYENIHLAADDLVTVKEVFEPNAANTRFYGERLPRFLELYRCASGIERRA